ncbi:hypothetical protein HYV91_00930 [Candidatus Wolfebacteria bacterium]|nr:hypothetical protein [Candidatus Wolfebacteria bacterium]
MIDFISQNIFWFKLAAGIISAIFVGIIIFFNYKLNLTGEKVEHWFDVLNQAAISKGRARRHWRKVQRYLAYGDEDHLEAAVLEARKILDEILKISGYQGKNLGERLGNVGVAELSNIEEVKQVYEIGNRIREDSGFVLSEDEAKKIVDIYEKAFREMGWLVGEESVS